MTLIRNDALRALLGGLAAMLVSAAARAQAAQTDVAPLMRYPNASTTSVAFVASGDLWTAPLGGGDATRLTHDPGATLFPRFSPDGRWIAFTARRAGGSDVYLIPAAGGAARRLTFDAASGGNANEVVAWTPDSRTVVFLSTRLSHASGLSRAFAVPVEGGLPQPLPLDHAGLLSFDGDGHIIAFNRIFRNELPKRYLGGRAQDIYTYDLDTRHLTRITDWKGTDTAPMWYGRRIYYLSDRGPGFRANIWVYDLDRRTSTQVTRFEDLDVDSPSLGAGTITFQQGGRLFAVDLRAGRLREIKVQVPDDGLRTEPRTQAVGGAARAADAMGGVDYALSPDGGQLLLSAHGDLFGVPMHGTARNHTATPGADEDHPSWSPDGRMIAYQTDASGAQQLAVRSSEDGPERVLTHVASGYFYSPVWSPVGDRLVVADAEHGLWLVPLDGDGQHLIARDAYGEIRDASFSPDGNWLAYSTTRANRQRAIHLRELRSGHDVVVSTPMNSDRDPVFSADGRLLLFVSQRNELPLVSDRDEETIIATLNSDGIFAATLDRRDPSPLTRPASDGPAQRTPLHVDLDGLMSRAVAIPVTPAVIASLEIRGNRLFYETRPPQLIDGGLPGEPSAFHVFDLSARTDRVIVRGLDGHSLAADGGSVAFRRGHDWHVAATATATGRDATLDLSTLRATVEPRLEWAEMFENAWRLDRDVFFSRAMNGDDWQAVHDAYVRLLPRLGSEEDFAYVLGQLQGELASSHCFIRADTSFDRRPPVGTGLLGVDYALDARSGRYRLARILPGDDSRAAFRSPLTAPGLALRDGDFLLAVNGRELKAPQVPDELLVGLTREVSITVAASPDGPRRVLHVEPIDDEGALRRFVWVERNRARVDRLSRGRIGYVALSDFFMEGWGEFVRQFYPQLDKQGLVFDVRWNRGGFTSQAVLGVLRRALAGMFVNREGAVSTLPVAVAPRAMVTLLNWGSGSDGDQFPYYFRAFGLGPLVGTRSWGGVQGINGPWRLMDGTFITIPKDSLADPAGHWVIENTGVAPDIEMDDTPDEAVTGRDARVRPSARSPVMIMQASGVGFIHDVVRMPGRRDLSPRSRGRSAGCPMPDPEHGSSRRPYSMCPGYGLVGQDVRTGLHLSPEQPGHRHAHR